MPLTPPSPVEDVPARYRAGTLTYTRESLFWLFVWLLWGDFVFTLMETVEPRILPILLKDHGASDSAIAVIVTSLASLLNCVINPIMSYRSDRTRTWLGRRIPYLLFATPFVAIFLALIPFAPDVTDAALRIPLLAAALKAAPVAPVIFVFAVLVVLFQLFNMVISSVYYYLFRDVVPPDHLGRFMSLFRCFGQLATFAFGYWVFGKAQSHTREIFVGISLVYAAGFSLMCWRVREGNYLPVEETEKTGGGLKLAVHHFVVQSFGAPIYCWIYATRTLVSIGLLSNVFAVFFSRDQLHLDLTTIGKLGAWSSVVCLPLAYPFGVLLDRLGSMRCVLATLILVIVTSVLSFYLIHDKWSWFVFGILGSAASFIYNIAAIVWLQRLFHPERMGQLSSACALVLSIGGVFMGPVCGYFFSWIHEDYRFHYLWGAVFTCMAFLAASRVQRHWEKLGGHENYRAPLPEAPSGAAQYARDSVGPI